MNPADMSLVRKRLHNRMRRAEGGFSIVEIMVAAAIALIGIVAIFQVLAVWEERKRTTSSGSDAQVSGTIAMYSMDRDLRQAGFGFGLSSYMGCTVQAYDTSRGTPAFTFNLYPIQIIDGASGVADEIRVLYGTSATYSANQTFSTSTATAKLMGVRAGFNKGDLAIVAGNATPDCALVEITDNTNANGQTIDHTTLNYVNYLGQTVTPRYNSPTGTGVTFTAGGMHNLGPGNLAAGSAPAQPRWNIWQVRSNNTLSWSDALHDASTWYDVAEGIVNLQAQYGVDANNDNMIDSSEWTITTPTNWTRVRAVRVGLLARSQAYDKLAVTATAPSWAGGSFTMRNLDGSTDSNPGDANDWRHYRYRVYDKIIPLRNIIWGTAP